MLQKTRSNRPLTFQLFGFEVFQVRFFKLNFGSVYNNILLHFSLTAMVHILKCSEKKLLEF
jgi:hypothetical protein